MGSLTLLAFMLSMPFILVNTAFTQSGSTVFVNDIAYFVSPDIAGRLPHDAPDLPAKFHCFGPVPVTVFTVSKPSFKHSDLSSAVGFFSSTDDVFQDGFLEGQQIFLLSNTLSRRACLPIDRLSIQFWNES